MSDEELIEIDAPFYRTNKYGDLILDKIPYGWRLYGFYYEAKSSVIAKYQKIRYGVSDRECWNLSDTLTAYILPRLKHFKKMRRLGYPSQLTENEWEAIIDEMIWTFEYMKDPDVFNPIPECWKNDNEDLKSYLNREKTAQEKQVFTDYSNKYKELEERKQKGLELFSKHYYNLFD